MSPPPPFPDFDFNFDPALFPNPPPLPASADLFSAAETTDLLGFLDNFNDFGWEAHDEPQQQAYPSPRAPYSNPHLNTAPEPSGRPRRVTRSSTSRASTQQQQTRESQPQPRQPQPRQKRQRQQQQQQQPPQPQQYTREFSERSDSQTPSNASESSSQANDRDSARSVSAPAPAPVAVPAPVPRGSKPLLSTPQKRLNHIMSEQKRRNAIRDGYAQLIALLAAPGSAPGLGMPQRGRPKGSGARDKGGSAKGKSGVLFRAVEYIQWLEEGRDALREEVLRVEKAAGISYC
ncbi:hypothetical protein C8R47DRAFT_1216717 [Mycena vitilis]|nr:hypothetical protein C8R47DRAFT_1216717 [Mycena vitilis]